VNQAAPPPPPTLVAAAIDAAPLAAPLPNVSVDVDRVEFQRESTRLGTTAPVRRVSIEQATHQIDPADLGKLEAKMGKEMAAAVSRQYAQELARKRPEKPDVKLTDQRAEVFAGLRTVATPVETMDFRGSKIPIARVPEELAAIAGLPDGKQGIDATDKQITDAEVASSFKTGRFKLHGPNPADADPATYCYVSKTTINGADHLYVAFDCRDPNLAALVTNHGDGTPRICADDSIEFFIDINGDRGNYHQIIINAAGRIYSTFAPDAVKGINGEGTPWNAGVKATVTQKPQEQRWICEFTIPYSAFGGVPAKGTKVPVNFCRNFRGQGAANSNNLQNWFLVYEGNSTNYHHPRLFGVLEWP
jgi:hypothetical protein